MSTMLRLCILAALAFVSIEASLEARGSSNRPVGTIAYVSGSSVCLVNANGSRRRCLTRGVAGDQAPVVWSADGRRLAFEREHETSDPSGRTEVLIMRVDGRSTLRLTPPAMQDFEPAWSPVAPRIAFTRWNGTRFGIFIARADGSGVRELRPRARFPSWSPDGRRIAFSADDAGIGVGIYVMNADGTRPRLLLRRASGPVAWSPDGRRLLFVDQTAGFKTHVFVMNSTGGGVRRLTRQCQEDYHPSWSPDGKKIAFQCLRRNGDIFTVNVDGTDLRGLTSNSQPDGFPAWSSDGKWIAYVEYRRDTTALSVMRSDGTGRQRIVPDVAEGQPTWQPRQ